MFLPPHPSHYFTSLTDDPKREVGMSQQYQQPHYDPTPVWVQPESASPEVVQPLPEQHAPHQHKPKKFGRIPSTPDWEGARRRLNIVGAGAGGGGGGRAGGAGGGGGAGA